MACDEVHVGDVGTAIEITLKDGDAVVDVSSATTKEIFLKGPDQQVSTHTAIFDAQAGVNGVIKYLTQAGDLHMAGKWKVQAHVILTNPAGEWKSDIDEFTVHENLA